MAASTAKGAHYKKARESFDHLEIEERAKFLLEATFSTISAGIERVSSAVSSEFDSVFDECKVSGEPKAKNTGKKASGAKKKKAKKSPSDDATS